MAMTRTQVSLTEAQMQALRDLAEERGVSLASLVRDGVDHVLARRDREQRHNAAREIVGAGTDDAAVAERHDDALDAAYHA